MRKVIKIQDIWDWDWERLKRHRILDHMKIHIDPNLNLHKELAMAEFKPKELTKKRNHLEH